MSERHEPHLRRAIALAEEAARHGNLPFGAVLVGPDGDVLVEEVNRTVEDDDVTSHAELNAVREASRRYPPEALARSTMYASTEPCPMCAGAIYRAGIPAVVYACSARSLAALAGLRYTIPIAGLLALGDEPVTIIGPLLESEGLAVHERQ